MQQKTIREEWGRIQTQAGKLDAELHRANVLLALKSDPQELNLIQREEIEQLLYRIGQWYGLRKIFPMIKFLDISKRRFLSGFEPVHFHETIEWAIAILRLSS